MLSPSPSPRKSSASIAASRNGAGSILADLSGSNRIVLQGTASATSLSGSATRSPHYDRCEELKENNTDNGSGRVTQGRPNQNARSVPKKPWVTHFSKSTGAVLPSNRILVDRNSSSPPQRSPGVARGNGEAIGDQKHRTVSPRDREEVCSTPGHASDVAELSKRIQQFLDEQDLVVGVKPGNFKEVSPSSPLLTNADACQRTLSSPYNPYRSPFFERPKFLRLSGKVTSKDDADFAPSSADVGDSVMQQTSKEFLAPEKNQVLECLEQQTKVSTNLCPCFVEDENKAQPEELLVQQCEPTLEEVPAIGVQDAFQPCIIASNAPVPQASGFERFDNQACLDKNALEPPTAGVQGSLQAKTESVTGILAIESAETQDCADEVEFESLTQELAFQPPTAKVKDTHKKSEDLANEALRSADETMGWGRNTKRGYGISLIFSTVVISVLLFCADPRLLSSPPLEKNASKQNKNILLLANGMEGLWSTEGCLLPGDVGAMVVKCAETLQSMKRSYFQKQLELQILFSLTTSALSDHWENLLKYVSSGQKDPVAASDQEESGRQFEWLQDYEFEEEWLDEIQNPQYTDWELLHEYDLGLANQFILDSISEGLRHDLLRNISRLSEALEVKGLLEDLMKLKGGTTEEDRLEVLQYFWEYTTFSANVHETLLRSQAGDGEGETGNSHQALFSDVVAREVLLTSEPNCNPEQVDLHTLNPSDSHSLGETNSIKGEADSPSAVMDDGLGAEQSGGWSLSSSDSHQHGLQQMPSTQVPDGEVSDPATTDEMWKEHQLTEDSQVNEAFLNTESLQQTSPNRPVMYASDEIEGQNVDAFKTEIQPFVRRIYSAIIGIFVIVSMGTLALWRLLHGAGKVSTTIARSVEFLRKIDQQQETIRDNADPPRDARWDTEQVTMIEDLNDHIASKLQSPQPLSLPVSASPQARIDQYLIKSPLLAPDTSPYGSFTTYKLVPKKEGEATETKLTPIRRSNRIRNHARGNSPSPQISSVKRVAISPP